MFGRHYQQLNEQRCPVNLPRETLNNISLTRGFPQYLFSFPRVTLTFCSLNRGISHGKPRQNRGKISMQVSTSEAVHRKLQYSCQKQIVKWYSLHVVRVCGPRNVSCGLTLLV